MHQHKGLAGWISALIGPRLNLQLLFRNSIGRMVCADQSNSRSIDFTAFDFIELSKGVPARICGNDWVLVKAAGQRRSVTRCYGRLVTSLPLFLRKAIAPASIAQDGPTSTSSHWQAHACNRPSVNAPTSTQLVHDQFQADGQASASAPAWLARFHQRLTAESPLARPSRLAPPPATSCAGQRSDKEHLHCGFIGVMVEYEGK